MKKFIIAIAIITLLTTLTTLSGCDMDASGTEITRCDFCADEKPCQSKTFMGDEVKICDECQAFMGTVFE